MKIDLEQVGSSSCPYCFRVAFHSSADRLLLQYPNPTDLEFTTEDGNLASHFCTQIMGSFPIDDFVLNRNQRIMFDLNVNVNGTSPEAGSWKIELPKGRYWLTFVYNIARDTEWYDFLAKRSRFAAITPIWRGTMRSNTIPVDVFSNSEDAK